MAVSVQVQQQLHLEKIQAAANKAAFKNAAHAAASIRSDAAASIYRDAESSGLGQPPHTRRGQLKRSIRYMATADKMGAIIGPLYSRVGLSGRAHEIGGLHHGEYFPSGDLARAYMWPALQRAAPRFAGSFQGSIGG